MKPLARPAPSASRAESVRQAIQWDAVKQRYLRAGYCEACAAQASWGHALGWGFRSDHPWPPADRGIKPSCPFCMPLVATFPIPPGAAGSAWRRLASPSEMRHKADEADDPAEREHLLGWIARVAARAGQEGL